MDLDKLFPTNLYHSYIIEGEPKTTAIKLLEFLESRGDVKKQSQDVMSQVYESFTMDDSYLVKEWHSRLGVTGGKKICILATKFINREAEQTLLKMIEEPAKNTHFFIIIPDSSLLLDTIISRTHVIKLKPSVNNDNQKFAQSFILSTPKERIDMVAKMIKENKDEENSGQLRFYATSFINDLENIFYKKFKENTKDEKIIFILNELQKSRGYLSTQGAGVKMILEHIALVV
jgi:DNA polymerase III delta prime subunit